MQDMFVNSVEPNLKKKIIHARSVKVNIPKEIAEILKKFSLKYSNIDRQLSIYKPPDIGTNIVFRSKDLILMKKVREICTFLK